MRKSTAIEPVLHDITSCLHWANAFKWNVIAVLDPQSASLLQRKEYDREVERSEELMAAGRLGGLDIGNK